VAAWFCAQLNDVTSPHVGCTLLRNINITKTNIRNCQTKKNLLLF